MLAFAGAAAGSRSRRPSSAARPGARAGARRRRRPARPAAPPRRPPPAALGRHPRRPGRRRASPRSAGPVHVGSVVTRGFAAGRVPWGNMYEFSSCAALVAVTAFLVLLRRGRVDATVGAFVMVPVTLYLGLAGHGALHRRRPARAGAQLVLDQDPRRRRRHGQRGVPAVRRHRAAVPAARPARRRWSARGRSPKFPLSLGPQPARGAGRWTARPTRSSPSRSRCGPSRSSPGAIWAEAAWGRYWGWDPKETWSFITWVLYAGYLHARATAGWKGRKAAWVAVAAAVALIVDYYVVNIFVVGLHSYA